MSAGSVGAFVLYLATAWPPPDTTGRDVFSPVHASLAAIRSRGLLETGLRPIYPDDHWCYEVVSAFGSTTRSDGFPRAPTFYHGHHSGVDIYAPIGTPVLAVADGVVVKKSLGRYLGGFTVVIKHAPRDTGLRSWLFAEYLHLREPSPLEIGQRVTMGQVVAYSGVTGRALMPWLLPNVHFETFISPDDEVGQGGDRIFFPKNGRWVDPLALYYGFKIDSEAIAAVQDNLKTVKIPFASTNGRVIPAHARLIWPLACEPR
jgi:murein DD-endopeptidase MepM/ murein hydrolase activator NlpD